MPKWKDDCMVSQNGQLVQAPLGAINVEGIPKELKELKDRWVVSQPFSNEDPSKKPKKIPYGPRTRRLASPTDPSTWASLDEAEQALREGPYDGLHFALNGDGIIGIDLDKCRNVKTGEIKPWAVAIMKRFPGYWEISPSGTGIRGFMRGTLPDGKSKNRKYKGGRIEVYATKKFLSVTGRRLTDYGATDGGLVDHSAELAKWYDETFGASSTPSTSTPSTEKENIPNGDLVINNPPPKFDQCELEDLWDIKPKAKALFEGSHGRDDQSAVEMSLANSAINAGWTEQRTCDLMVQARLNVGEQPKHLDYYVLTIGKAVAALQERQGHAQPSNGQANGHVNGDANGLEKAIKRAQRLPLGKDVSQHTELANSVRFVDGFGDDLRYVVEWKEWIGWDGQRWKRDVGGVAVQQKSKEVSEDLWDDWRMDRDNKGLLAFARRSCTAKSIAATSALARSALPIEVKQLDQHDWLLNVANGTLDLRTGELREPRREDFITKLCPTKYDPEAPCATWERFLMEVFGNNQALVRYLQRILGYGITGDVREQVLPILWGEGSNGKSTLITAVTNVLGEDYGGTAPRELFAVSKSDRHPTELMTLQGKRLMSASETDAGTQLNEALVKHLTGGDGITARGMYENFSTFRPTHKLLLSTNYKPQIKGTDWAMWRRIALIPFAVQFKGENMDKDMPKKLEAEREGILAWLVRGCLDWQRQGLAPPCGVEMATSRYRADEDVVGRFLNECCEVGEDYSEEAGALWEAFKVWAGEEAMTQTAFGRELGKRGYASGKVTSGKHPGRKTWKGLRLLLHRVCLNG
jgi:putative DNA primase/helicase